ncbi:DUF7315 family membrane protein [Halocatena halophila]|uniref:DUF7315 family membrane protein n=1 Tax=Halocatena halophila TaxID=2814576 RepID=UPI002ED01701
MGDRTNESRDVEVPLEVYKIVTVFSTLFAAVAVVGGFMLLDTATNQATASLETVNVVLAILGIAVILAGAALYIFSTRFRTPEMGNPKDGPD